MTEHQLDSGLWVVKEPAKEQPVKHDAPPRGCTKTPEQWAEMILDSLIGEETTMGWLGPGRQNDPNRWKPNGNEGECYVKILAIVREMLS